MQAQHAAIGLRDTSARRNAPPAQRPPPFGPLRLRSAPCAAQTRAPPCLWQTAGRTPAPPLRGGVPQAAAGLPADAPSHRDVVDVQYVLDAMRAVTVPHHDKQPQVRALLIYGAIQICTCSPLSIGTRTVMYRVH